ncbi:glycosyltransferase family 2 protein [Tessaracoccus sp. Z1128]
MPGPEPNVTLVAACYNHARFLRDCLRSIAAQTIDAFDLIVTDDASTDGSQDLIRATLAELGLKARTMLSTSNRGICATFNAALAEVQTPYVAFLSTDDVLMPTRLEHQVDLLDALGPDVAFVYGDMPVVDGAGERTGDYFYGPSMPNRYLPGREDMYRELLSGNFIAAPSVMMRAEALRAVGGYDDRLAYEDYDVWCKLTREYRVGFDDHETVLYRREGAGGNQASLSDELQFARRATYLLTNVRILAKHLGQSRELDQLITGRAYSYAMEAYKLGARDRELYQAFLARLRVSPSVRGVLLTLLAVVRVPIQKFLPSLR